MAKLPNVLLFAALSVTTACASCLPVTGDRIFGRDLALAERAFSALPAALPVSYAPVPGSTRIFAVAELQRIARVNGVTAAALTEICFEVPIHLPADDEFADAMRAALPANTTLRLVDRSRTAIPIGPIQFPLAGLEPVAQGSDGVQLWRGFVQYTDTRRIAIWTRVAIATTYAAVIVTHDVAAGIPLDPAVLRVEIRTGLAAHPPYAAHLEEVAGRVLDRPLKAGSEVPLKLLNDAPAVHRGDSVRVEVRSGRALLHFDAIAEANSRAGDIAEFRNPVNGKTFRARMAASGAKAVIVVGSHL